MGFIIYFTSSWFFNITSKLLNQNVNKKDGLKRTGFITCALHSKMSELRPRPLLVSLVFDDKQLRLTVKLGQCARLAHRCEEVMEVQTPACKDRAVAWLGNWELMVCMRAEGGARVGGYGARSRSTQGLKSHINTEVPVPLGLIQ